MGMGSAKGEDKAQLAAMAAISSPLLETSISGAMGVLVSITASEDIQLDEIETASQMIYEEAHPDANIIWGAAFDPTLEDEMRVTIIATGFDHMKRENVKPEPPVRENVAPIVPEQPKAEEPKVAPVIEEPKREEPAPAPVAEKKSSIEGSNIELKVVRPESVEEIFTIADYLIDGCTVVLNLEILSPEEITRMLDFLNGVTYTKGGDIKNVSPGTFIITPTGINIDR